MHRVLVRLALAAALAMPGSVTLAQDDSPVPDRRVAISRNLDFVGADLANIFDTTLDACQNACQNTSQGRLDCQEKAVALP